jgi:hypothetical protein
MLVRLLRRHLEEERLNPAARAGVCADLCMFGSRERRALARLSWLQLRAYAAAGSGWMCPSWVKRVYWS